MHSVIMQFKDEDFYFFKVGGKWERKEKVKIKKIWIYDYNLLLYHVTCNVKLSGAMKDTAVDN